MTNNPVRSYVDYSGGQLHYRRWQSDSDDSPWVLLHHSASDSRSLLLLGQALSNRGFDVISLDTPGFGMSDPIDHPTMDAFSNAIHEALRGLGLESWSLFGHHSGASFALRLALRTPNETERAVLSGILLTEPADKTRLSNPLMSLKPDQEGSHLMSAWNRVSRYTPDAPLHVLTREATSLLSAVNPHLVYQMLLDYDSRTDLTLLKCPLLVICGEREHLAASAPVAATLAEHGSWEIIPGAGLDAQETHSNEMADLILGFANNTRVKQ